MLSALYTIARPSVRLSVIQMYHRKTVEVRVMKFLPYGSPITLVFAEILWGSPEQGRRTREGWVKSAFFYLYAWISRKR